MGRPAEVFVRPVSMTEGRRLQRIARRSLTGSLAVRPIRCNRRPSVIDTGRTNTSGGRPIATSENSPGSSLPYSAKDQLHEQGSWTQH